MSFVTNGYEVVNGAIDPFCAKLLATEFQLLRDNIYRESNVDLKNETFNNDDQVPISFSWYAPLCFESLMVHLLPKVEEVTGKILYPAYSYARIYYNGAVMERHHDRKSCQYSATITIEVDDEVGPWEIFMRNFDGEANALVLPTGSMVVYRGDKLEHWREDPYKGKKQIQAFLHYVDADGEYANFKWDTRPMLGGPVSSKMDHSK
jgi:hypothetical protein